MRLVWINYGEYSAVENMAIDRAMLDVSGSERNVYFRSYGWGEPSFTFGYTQRYVEVKETLPKQALHVCRRPTGGGVVDHRRDWTYSIALSTDSFIAKYRPMAFYSWLHEMIVRGLADQEFETYLYQQEMNSKAGADVCFRDPSPGDVICARTGAKIAGAALKRTKLGMLAQGSISKDVVQGLDFQRFEEEFVKQISRFVIQVGNPVKKPYLDRSLWIRFQDQFSDPNWNMRR